MAKRKVKMKNITEEVLISFGFEKKIVAPDESGWDEEFYYYSLDIGKEFPLSLLSCSDDQSENGLFWVEMLEYSHLGKFTNSEILKELIEIVTNLEKP